MADLNSRIEQFKKMTEADPTNALGHYSLGRAYLESGEIDGAILSLSKVITLDANMSRAYELLASALLKRDRKDEAIGQLSAGIKIAHARGDVMPKNEMIKMLQDLGAPLPELPKGEERPVGEGEVLCARCNRVNRRIAAQPFRNDVGKMIYEKICADCWREWIGMGTKVINELRLPLNDPQASKIYDSHMLEFLNLK